MEYVRRPRHMSRVVQKVADSPYMMQYDPVYSRGVWPRFKVPGWAHMMFGLVLIILGIVDVAYTISKFDSDCRYYGTEFLPGPCEGNHNYTYIASPIWGGIFMILNGALTFYMTASRLRYNMWILQTFCGFSIFLVLAVCPAIIVLNVLEIIQNKDVFWKDDGGIELYDAVKFSLPITIVVMAGVEWVVAIMSACICICCLPREFHTSTGRMRHEAYRPYWGQPYREDTERSRRGCPYMDRYNHQPIIMKDDKAPLMRANPEFYNNQQPIILKQDCCTGCASKPASKQECTCDKKPEPIIIRESCPPCPPQQAPQPIIINQTPPQPPVIVRSESRPSIVHEPRRDPMIIHHESRQPKIIREESRPPIIIRDEGPREPIIIRDEGPREPIIIRDNSRSRDPIILRDNSRSRDPIILRDNSRSRDPIIIRDESRDPMIIRDNFQSRDPMIIRDNFQSRDPMIRDNFRSRDPMLIRDNFRSRDPIMLRDESRDPMIIRDNFQSRDPIIIREEPPRQPIILRNECPPQPIIMQNEPRPQPIVMRNECPPQPIIMQNEPRPQPIIMRNECPPQPIIMQNEPRHQPIVMRNQPPHQPIVFQNEPPRPPIIIRDEPREPMILRDEAPRQPIIVRQQSQDPIIIREQSRDPIIIREQSREPLIIHDEPREPLIIHDESNRTMDQRPFMPMGPLAGTWMLPRIPLPSLREEFGPRLPYLTPPRDGLRPGEEIVYEQRLRPGDEDYDQYSRPMHHNRSDDRTPFREDRAMPFREDRGRLAREIGPLAREGGPLARGSGPLARDVGPGLYWPVPPPQRDEPRWSRDDDSYSDRTANTRRTTKYDWNTISTRRGPRY